MKILKIIAITATITTIVQINNINTTLAADIDYVSEFSDEINNVTTGSAVTIKLENNKATEPGNEIIEIKDSTLESIIREQIGKETGDITKADMLNVRSFNISDKIIHSLSGLEYATNMGGITAKNCTIEGDMSPLSGIDKFSYISFHNCNIDSLYGLPTNLTLFTLYKCNIKDNKLPLENQTKLRNLDVVGCGISDISSLKDSVNLKYVRLSENNIKDITVLNNLTQITDLGLFKNNVSDITPIQSLTNLTNLWLENNDISDITPLSSLTKLEYLNIANDSVYEPDNKITDITALSGTMSNMQSLYLYLNKIPTYEPLEGIPETASIHGTAWLKVRYVDENDNDISEPLNRNINFTDNINFKITKDYSDRCIATARKINGYTLNDDDSKSVEFDKNSLIKTLVFRYKKDNTIPSTVKGSTTIQYKIKSTGEFLESETINSNLDLGTYSYKAKSFDGYILDDNKEKSVTLTESQPNQTIIFEYKKKSSSSHKHDKDPEPVIPPVEEIETVKPIDPPTPPVEKIIKGSYIVRHIYESENSVVVLDEKAYTDLSLGQYTELSKSFDGYILNDDTEKSITLDENNITGTIEFKYDKIKEIQEPIPTELPKTGDNSRTKSIPIVILLSTLSSLFFILKKKQV